jgi:CxxC motif-containing protein
MSFHRSAKEVFTQKRVLKATVEVSEAEVSEAGVKCKGNAAAKTAKGCISS